MHALVRRQIQNKLRLEMTAAIAEINVINHHQKPPIMILSACSRLSAWSTLERSDFVFRTK